MALHHRDATVWDANQGVWVNSSSTAGSGTPVGVGVSADSGAANISLLFPGQTIRDNVLGRIGTIISANQMPTGAPGGEVSPATIASVIFNSGLPAEQVAVLITTARYSGQNAAAFLIFSDSADGSTQAATHYGSLSNGATFGATYAFTAGNASLSAGIVDGTVITGATLIADGASGEIFVYSGTPASGNLIGSNSAVAGSDAHGNATLAGWAAYASVGGVGHAAALTGGKLALYDTVSFPSGSWPATAVATIDFDANLDTIITTAGQLLMTDGAGLSQQVSGSQLANSSAGITYPVQDVGTGLPILGFMTVPANDVATGATYEVHASGSFSTGTSVPSSATFKLFWGGTGGTLIASLAIPGTIAASLSGASWFLDAEVNWLSPTEAETTIRVGWHTGSGVAGSVVYFTVSDTGGLSVVTQKNLTLAFQWGSAPTGTNFLCDACRLGRIA